MSEHARTVTLASGPTITLTAWTLEQISANTADYFNLLRAFLADLKAEATLDQEFTTLLVRLVRLSLAQPEDATHVTARDLPEVLEAIWELNELGEFAKKLLSLHHRLQANLLEALPSST